jgi:hypothetical protein
MVWARRRLGSPKCPSLALVPNLPNLLTFKNWSIANSLKMGGGLSGISHGANSSKKVLQVGKVRLPRIKSALLSPYLPHERRLN